MLRSWLTRALGFGFQSRQRRRRNARPKSMLLVERLDNRTLLTAIPGTPGEIVQSGFTAAELAQSLVGPGVVISNATFTGGATAAGSFSFTDTTVIGFGQGIVLSSGNVADVVGPNTADSTSTDFGNPGNSQLDSLSTYSTFDAAVLEFDFTPTANQVVFNYVFASDEYPEWVNTPYNDVFAFYVNGINYATVRQIAGDPNSTFVPVAVNNINAGNPQDPGFVAARPDLFRPNYVDPNGGPSAIALELDGLTRVLIFQAPVNPGVVNHMQLAIADASDGIYDSAVFIQSGSLVSNENPVADLSLQRPTVAEPNKVTAIVEAEDPNGLPLTYTIDWGDGTTDGGPLDSPANENEKTTTASHIYAANGDYIVTLTVSNGTLTGTGTDDVHIGTSGGGGGGGDTGVAPVVLDDPADQMVVEGQWFSLTAAASGDPAPEVQWQVSIDAGVTFEDILGATDVTYTAQATLADNGNLYQAVFTNDAGAAVTSAALLTVLPAEPIDTTPPEAPLVSLSEDTGLSATDLITNQGTLSLSGIEDGATVEYSTDNGSSWSNTFTPVEGLNTVLVRQTDQAGNVSEVTTFSFNLDTLAPAMLTVELLQDTGVSATDRITQVGMLTVTGTEPDARVEYSSDDGATWTSDYAAVEGINSVSVRQVDAAGNVGPVTLLEFRLDTTAPQLQPTFSTGSDLLLVNTPGVTVSPNAFDAGGLDSQTAGLVETSSPGHKTLVCTATDLAGNTASVVVPYQVGYSLAKISPDPGATYKASAKIVVTFQLQDANGPVSRSVATSLLKQISVTAGNQTFDKATYNKGAKTFKLRFKARELGTGSQSLSIHVVAGDAELATAVIPIQIV